MKSFYFLWILSFVAFGDAISRKMTTVVNPDCGILCDKTEPVECYTNLVYTKSEGPEDTLHHVWTTVGQPSFLLLQTEFNESLKFNWTIDANSSQVIPEISCDQDILYSFAFVFNKIWEYRDPKDKGSFSESMENLTFADFQDFCWKNVVHSVAKLSIYNPIAIFSTNLSTTDNFIHEGILSLELETQGQDGRSETIPRLLFTSNTSQVRVVLDSLHPQFDESRFAVEMTIFGSDRTLLDNEDLFRLSTVKSMDDEYTPGVFKYLHLQSKESVENLFGGFVSWKPVAYTTDAMSVTDSTSTVYCNSSRTSIMDTSSNSVASTFFKSRGDNINGTQFITSFGNSQDGYYTATKFTQWSFAYGLGIPGEDKLSTLVIIVIASGLGLPMLLIVLSTAYLIWHKLKKDNDDLRLSRN